MNYSLLILKLKFYDYSDLLLQCFLSFLSNRIQNLKYENVIYDNFYGVPQDDHLLSLFFINNISSKIKNLKNYTNIFYKWC